MTLAISLIVSAIVTKELRLKTEISGRIRLGRIAIEGPLYRRATATDYIAATDRTERSSTWIRLVASADVADVGTDSVWRTVADRLGAETGHAYADTAVVVLPAGGVDIGIAPVAVFIETACAVANVGATICAVAVVGRVVVEEVGHHEGR